MVAKTECGTSTDSPVLGNSVSIEHYSQIKDENVGLRIRVQRLEGALAKVKTMARNFREERDRIKKKMRDLQSTRVTPSGDRLIVRSNRSPTPSCADDSSSECTKPNSLLETTITRSISPPPSVICAALERGEFKNGLATKTNTVISSPSKVTTKVAEKVRLRRISPAPDSKSKWVDGGEISTLGINSTAVAEYLVNEITEESVIQECLYGLETTEKSRNVELQIERLRTQSESLRAELSYLELTLSESRSCSEYLATVCAQLESNQTALKLSLNYSTQIEEISDCLIQLVLAGNSNSTQMLLAKKLLNLKVDRGTLTDDDMSDRPSTSDEGFSSAPDGKMSSLPNMEKSELINLLLQKKCNLVQQKDMVLDTVLGLDTSFHQWDSSYCSSGTINGIQQQRIDLENAILIQELSSLKEERADLKCQLYLCERDKESVELVLNGKLAELEASRIFLEQTGPEAKSNSESSPDEMRHRFADLMDAVHIVTENADLRQEESERMMIELRHANESLVQAFDKMKRKHRDRFRRFQEQTDVMRERYEAQLRLVRQEINGKNCSDIEEKNMSI